MAELFRAEQMSDPTRALKIAQQRLPEIEDEEQLNDERGDLAALLVNIANNIAQAAMAAEATTEKQRLLDRLDEQLELIENPMYMTSQLRTTLSARLQEVAEARARVRRDIARNLRLDEAVAAIEGALEEQATKRAFDIRFELLREFRELHDNPRLEELVETASEIQQTLVEPSARAAEVAQRAPPAQRVGTLGGADHARGVTRFRNSRAKSCICGPADRCSRSPPRTADCCGGSSPATARITTRSA